MQTGSDALQTCLPLRLRGRRRRQVETRCVWWLEPLFRGGLAPAARDPGGATAHWRLLPARQQRRLLQPMQLLQQLWPQRR